MHHAFKLGEADHNLELSRSPTGYRLHLPDRVIAVSLADGVLTVAGSSTPVLIATRGDDVFVHLDGEAWQLHYEHPLERLAHQGQGASADAVRAPMPGSLVTVGVKPGQAVMRGETLLVMESMKMETTIAAPRDGVVAAVNYATGQTFERDAVLLMLEAVK
ncbi:MAG TPA: biotin/lipoyl-containing protein [Solimonas sp.]|nr:biotin/lipoyl-containing protein [Solimonas sp.]